MIDRLLDAADWVATAARQLALVPILGVIGVISLGWWLWPDPQPQVAGQAVVVTETTTSSTTWEPSRLSTLSAPPPPVTPTSVPTPTPEPPPPPPETTTEAPTPTVEDYTTTTLVPPVVETTEAPEEVQQYVPAPEPTPEPEPTPPPPAPEPEPPSVAPEPAPEPVPPPAPEPPPAAPAQDMDGEFVALINAARADAGVTPLQVSGGLTDLAVSWSKEQLAAGDMSHNPNLEGDLPDYGVNANAWAENVAYWTADRVSVQRVFDGYMSSAGHRQNILNPRYGFVGVGTVCESLCFNTMVFTDRVDGG